MAHLPRRQRLYRAPGMPTDATAIVVAKLRALAEASVDRRLGDLDVRALVLLAAARLDVTTGLTSTSGEQLAVELSIAVRSSFRVLGRLEAAGYLVGYRSPGRSTIYSIEWKRFSIPGLTGESGGDGVRHRRIGRRAPWAFRLRQDPLPFPYLVPAEMDRAQIVVSVTYAVAHDIEFKRAIRRTAGCRGTDVCRLGRDILAGGAIAARHRRLLSDGNIERLRHLLEHDDASVFKDRAEVA